MLSPRILFVSNDCFIMCSSNCKDRKFVNNTGDNEVIFKKQNLDVLLCLYHKRFTNQRSLADDTGLSLGSVNKSLKILGNTGLIDELNRPTDKAEKLIRERSPRRAVILAAGFGMRMAPINFVTSKALIEVKGEVLIERQIRHLIEVGITDISIVVGFMKESFDYLVDKFGVKLIVNDSYASMNNIYSVGLASDRLDCCYIVPCDIWCRFNPFSREELYSWYMVSNENDSESTVRINRKNELATISSSMSGNRMIGITYLIKTDSDIVESNLKRLLSDRKHDECFWETALFNNDRMIVNARIVPDDEIREINTYEQLREIDSASDHLKSDAINFIADVFSCEPDDITDIEVLKKGMTNRSFVFAVEGSKYIMRIPGVGTEKLIDRTHETKVYKTISGLGLCDDPIRIDAKSGYKITKYLEGVRTCNVSSEEDLVRCMKKLRAFHEMNIKVDHTFDIFGQIEFYESLWNGEHSIFRDYEETKEKVFSLQGIINGIKKKTCLTHIDAVPDNFLFYKPERSGEELLHLTDWEYSGMQDPHVDIAMFCIYSLFNKDECDRLINIYFEDGCSEETRGKIYCYIASCGLLWSNWCEYKRSLGVEFGEYSICQYRYAKDFYRYAKELL